MADNYKSLADVTVQADQFDLTTTPKKIPATCIIDPDYDRIANVGEGYKVLTTSGWARPVSTDWIIQKGGKVFIINATNFASLFTTV